MSKNITQRRAPGSVEPFVTLNPAPVTKAKFAPTVNDYYDPSTIWIQPTDINGNPVNSVWISASNQNGVANWVQIAGEGGVGTFSSLTVTPGPISLTGTTTINLTGTSNTNIGTTSNSGTITIGNTISNAQSIVLQSASAAGIALNAAGQVSAQLLNSITASPTAATTINGRLGYATFTGFTTAAAGIVTFTITNSMANLGSGILASANNLGSNDAKMTVSRILPLAGGFQIALINNGAAALNGDINITFWVLD